MSVSILLIPAAVAAATALHKRAAAGADPGVVYQVGTRMKDVELLEHAIAGAGGSVERTSAGLSVKWSGIDASFHRDAEEIWTADFTGAVDEAAAIGLVRAVDEAYGLLVQQTVLARIRERAAGAGMSLTSQTANSDASVTIVLAVDRIIA